MNHVDNDQLSRSAIVEAMQSLVATGLTSGTSGNVSVRIATGMLITPTGVRPAELLPEHIVHLDPAGAASSGELRPSSEWRMHADVYQHRADVGAIVHCHSSYATILACARKPVPAVHYMVAAAGGSGIPLADYATFGSESLSRAAVEALSGARACLLANHGQLATGADLAEALRLAALVEELSHWYWGVLAIGGGTVLDTGQMDDVLAAFSSYGQQERRKDT